MADKNLTPEELKKVQELNQKFLQTKVEIADQFVALVKKVPALDDIQSQFGELEKELIKSYYMKIGKGKRFLKHIIKLDILQELTFSAIGCFLVIILFHLFPETYHLIHKSRSFKGKIVFSCIILIFFFIRARGVMEAFLT